MKCRSSRSIVFGIRNLLWFLLYLPCYLFIVYNSGLLFFHVGRRQHSSILGLLNIGHRTLPKIWYVSCTERQRNDFELILTVKMETRHPVEESFGSKFTAICNHCGVMTAWSRKTSKFCERFLRFLRILGWNLSIHLTKVWAKNILFNH